MRDISNARWALWFRDLDAARLEPVELSGRAVGTNFPINLRLTKSIVSLRVKWVCQMAGDPRNPPPWFCNELRLGGKGQCRRVGRVLPDGTVERYASLREASRVTGVSASWIDHLAATCSVNSTHCRWFDD